MMGDNVVDNRIKIGKLNSALDLGINMPNTNSLWRYLLVHSLYVYKVSPTQIQISNFLDTNYSLEDVCAFGEVFQLSSCLKAFNAELGLITATLGSSLELRQEWLKGGHLENSVKCKTNRGQERSFCDLGKTEMSTPFSTYSPSLWIPSGAWKSFLSWWASWPDEHRESPVMF